MKIVLKGKPESVRCMLECLAGEARDAVPQPEGLKPHDKSPALDSRPPLQIESGCYYVSGQGDIYGPAVLRTSEHPDGTCQKTYPWVLENVQTAEVDTFCDDGKHAAGGGSIPSKYDLLIKVNYKP